MSLRISGTLYDPFGAPAVAATVRFTAESTSTEILDCYVATATVDSVGAYSLDIQFGTYTIESRQEHDSQWCVLAKGVVIDESVASDDLNVLILESDPDGPGSPSLSAQIDAIAAVASNAEQVAAGASDAAAASQASATTSAASASQSQGYATEALGHANSAQGYASEAEASAAAAAQSASDAIIPAATETSIGGVEVATSAEALAGTAGKFPDAAKVLSAIGQFGIGAIQDVTDLDGLDRVGLYRYGTGAVTIPSSSAGCVWHGHWSSSSAIQVAVAFFPTSPAGNMYTRYKFSSVSSVSSVWSDWKLVRSENNTVIDANGFVKEASPVLRLHGDGSLTGNGHADLANATASRLSEGVYEVSGTLGLASSGWTVQTPEDANGRRKVFVEYGELDGIISVQTFVADYTNGAPVKGDPLDIPDGRWIDIRTNEAEPVETPPE